MYAYQGMDESGEWQQFFANSDREALEIGEKFGLDRIDRIA